MKKEEENGSLRNYESFQGFVYSNRDVAASVTNTVVTYAEALT